MGEVGDGAGAEDHTHLPRVTKASKEGVPRVTKASKEGMPRVTKGIKEGVPRVTKGREPRSMRTAPHQSRDERTEVSMTMGRSTSAPFVRSAYLPRVAKGGEEGMPRVAKGSRMRRARATTGSRVRRACHVSPREVRKEGHATCRQGK